MSMSPDTNTPRGEAQQGLLTITEAGEALRISRWSIYRLINAGKLRTVRIDRRRLIAPADLSALIEELRAEGGEHV